MSNWALIEHLTNYLAKDRVGHAKHPTLWPSEASAVITNEWGEEKVVGKCRRATFFRYAIANYEFDPKYQFLRPLVEKLKQEVTPVDKYMYWIWTAGQLYEDYVVNLAKNSGVFIDDQIRVYIREHNVSGLIDLRVINPFSHKKVVAEVKSVYGHGANMVLGTPASRRRGVLGTPRDSNLMQIAIYDWAWAKKQPDHEDSILVYGARDTGRFAEYKIRTEENDEGVVEIYYAGSAPSTTSWTKSPITITSIMEDGYDYVTKHVASGIIPPRDFDLHYSREQIDEMYQRKELGMTDTKQYDKIVAREKENEERIASGQKPKVELKAIAKGDFQCRYCKFAKSCYSEDGSTREI